MGVPPLGYGGEAAGEGRRESGVQQKLSRVHATSHSKSFTVVLNAHDESEGAGKAPKQAGGGAEEAPCLRRPAAQSRAVKAAKAAKVAKTAKAAKAAMAAMAAKAAMTRLKSDARKGSLEARLMSLSG